MTNTINNEQQRASTNGSVEDGSVNPNLISVAEVNEINRQIGELRKSSAHLCRPAREYANVQVVVYLPPERVDGGITRIPNKIFNLTDEQREVVLAMIHRNVEGQIEALQDQLEALGISPSTEGAAEDYERTE